MIVRKYGRRNRGITRSYSDFSNHDEVVQSEGQDSDDPFSDFSELQDCPQESYANLPFVSSSQGSSSHFDFSQDWDNYSGKNGRGVLKKPRKTEPVNKEKSLVASSLLEMQECGEMMENEDEVNFALDGLRKGQPVRIRRASLLSLLSITGTLQQRRMLRIQGTTKTIIDSILDLSYDDEPSNLATTALLYVLTSDGQDHLLESHSCIRFLLRMLKPHVPVIESKAPSVGCRLLALRKDVDMGDKAKRFDSSSANIARKVLEVLINCKDLKSAPGVEEELERPELSPKWIALLTLEKACLSKISLEETSGSVKKIGDNFKEKLRQLGGLDAVFNAAIDCYSKMEGWLQHGSRAIPFKGNADAQCLALLLKCLKIMENATFLSKENQTHLLQMKGKVNSQEFQFSFTKLILSVIKILSDLSLLRDVPTISSNEETYSFSNGSDQAFELLVVSDRRVDSNGSSVFCSSSTSRGTDTISSQKSFIISQNSQWPSSAQSVISISSSESPSISAANTSLLKMTLDSSRSSDSVAPLTGGGLGKKSSGLGRRSNFPVAPGFEFEENSQDPFAFDEDEFEPSRWDSISQKQKVTRTQKTKKITRNNHSHNCQFSEAELQLDMVVSQQESSNGNYHHFQDSPRDTFIKATSNLMADCLLSSVKVLMNLTNDNPVGCQQIAACDGLEILSSLIASHFPIFSSPASLPSKSKIEFGHQNEGHLGDQELDLLVAILGLFVNLVEKDSCNRSRLAAATVPFPGKNVMKEENRKDVIPLFCSIFLTNQGAGEAVEEDVPWNDEAIQQGEREAEKTILEAYAALLLAFLSTESKSIRDAIASCLPEQNLRILVPVLERFVEFHLSLNMISPETHTAVTEVIESCRIR